MRKTNENTKETTSKKTPATKKNSGAEQITLEKSVKPAPKKAPKKETPKKDNEVTLEKETKGVIPLVKYLPETLSLYGMDFRAAREIKSYADLLKLYENDDFEGEVYIAGYWNKRHLQQYDYGTQFHLNNFNLTSFKDNLDMLSVVYVCDNEDEPCAVAVSTYTGAIYKFYGNEIPEIIDEDEGYRLRVSNGMEYEIYVPADTDLSKYLK